MPYTEDIAHEAVEDRMDRMDEMDQVLHDDPANEWDEDPRAAMYDAMADEWAGWDSEPDPYAGTYSEM